MNSANADRVGAVVAVIDGVTCGAQVAELMPAAGVVLAVSRAPLPDLLADGAVPIEIGPLPEPAAADWLTQMLTHRAHRTPRPDVLAAVRACGAMPRPLKALAAAAHAAPTRPFTDLIATRRTTVRTTLEAFYQAADPQTRAAYRRLTVLKGPHFSGDAAGEAFETPPGHTALILAAFTQAGLVEHAAPSRPGFPDRWTMSRTVADHARGLLAGLDGGAEHDAALARVGRHYLAWAASLDQVLVPERARDAAVFSWAPPASAAVTDPQTALELLGEWAETLVSTQLALSTAHHDALAWMTAEVLSGYVVRRQDYVVWAQATEIGLSSAQRIRDQAGLCRLNTLAGALERALGRPEHALDHHQIARSLAYRTGNRRAHAASAEHLGASLLACGRNDEALAVLRDGLTDYQALGTPHPRGHALLTRYLAMACAATGDHDTAAEHLTAAEREFTRLGEPYMLARLAINRAQLALARAAEDPAHLDAAAVHLDRAERTPALPPAHRVDIAHLRAQIALLADQPDRARDALDHATRLAAAHLPPGHPTIRELHTLTEEIP